MKKVAVIGGGAAGMLAAISAARQGAEVFLLERNDRLGKKLFITGKGRCNLTNACGETELLEHVVSNPKFLFPAFRELNAEKTIQFFEALGLRTKIERGLRVFPQSDHSSDVIRVLAEELKRYFVQVKYSARVKKILCTKGQVSGVLLEDGTTLHTDACILATGGLSYPSTGSTGDGYQLARELGHTITALSPSLVGIHVKETWVGQLQGLSLKNTGFRLVAGERKEPDAKQAVKRTKLNPGKVLYEDFGELIFTQFGVSGPVILSASSYLAPYLDMAEFIIHLDLKPALTKEQLNQRILRDFEEVKNKHFKNAFDNLLPQKMIRVIIERSMISPEKQVNAITREERERVAGLLKDFTMSVCGLGGYPEAVITKGGISVKEVIPSTMESKLVKGLHFAGEVLDLDALTGGFNLQIAWSTGYLAGKSAALLEEKSEMKG